MNVLVTGGAGFIGSNLVKALVKQGDEVTVLDNLSSGFEKNIPETRLIVGDVRDVSLLQRIMKGIDTVYHLAASVGNKRSVDNPRLDAEINVMGTLSVLEAARKHHIKKIILSSSAGIFGELNTLPIQEDHAIEPQTPYACSKLYAEKIALAYAKLYDIEAVCLRYFNVYGPNQRFDAYGNVIPIFVFQMLKGQSLHIFGDGEQTRDFINVHDVVQANIKSAKIVGLSGAFNVASGTRISINTLVNTIKGITGIDSDIKYQSPRPGDVRHSLACISAAKKAFGFNPVIDLTNGLKEYIDWAKYELKAKGV